MVIFIDLSKQLQMRKFFCSFFITLSVFVSHYCAAQTKIGYFNPDEMISYMSEKPAIDTLLTIYQRDSVIAAYKTVLNEYQYKDSMLTQADTSHTPKSVLAEYRNSVNMLGYELRNWQTLSQQAIQAKGRRLYAPLYNKINNALDQVAKEKGYKYVLIKDVFLIAGPGDDLLPFVAAKLGIKLPANSANKN